MLRAQVCETNHAIRQLVKAGLEELVADMQEVRLTVSSAVSTGILYGYEAAHGDCGQMDVLVFCQENVGKKLIPLAEISRLEVLPTRRMCPAHAYRQMRQMEQILPSA